ncbi:hypothetical protein SRABI96_04071 [Peribacillus sp. Bi96]|nr:hypothetical protein SRABI96_04071 [Peribacillus sp. Bi96]
MFDEQKYVMFILPQGDVSEPQEAIQQVWKLYLDNDFRIWVI